VGTYQDLIRDTVAEVLEAGDLMSVDRLARVVTPRILSFSRDERFPIVDPLVLRVVLTSNPALFVEVAPGIWTRRRDGPEAGVPSRPARPPLAGSAAAAARPPERPVSIDAVGGGAKISPAAS
jgi:hypothetical protein